jgi:hypothetical protein
MNFGTFLNLKKVVHSIRGSLNTIDLFVLSILEQLLFILKHFFFFFTKQPILMGQSTILRVPLQQGFPGAISELFKGEKRN